MDYLYDRPKLFGKDTHPSNGIPDMTIISDIDEKSINENLKTRFHRDEIYTYTGNILVAVNPYKRLAIYDEEKIATYHRHGVKLRKLPPHIYAIAESAQSDLRKSNLNQSIIISGESGAGKTESTKFILQYLCSINDNATRWIEQQIIESNTILEAFGNAKTLRNDNSSRFGKFIQVNFDVNNQISGCVIKDYLLEQSRVTFQGTQERNYHIFYQLLAGGLFSSELREKFMLAPPFTFTYLNQSDCYSLDGVDDREMFDSLRLAMTVVNIPADMSDGVFAVLSAILWLGNLKFQDVDGERCDLTSQDAIVLRRISKLLGLKEGKIEKLLLMRELVIKGVAMEIPFKLDEARDNRHAMAKALYSRIFAWIIHQINSCIDPGNIKDRFIGVLDIFGFENFQVNSFEQLCINFTNEKLHRFFNYYVFALEQDLYEEEGINFHHIKFTDNTACLQLIEQSPCCILGILDEECRFPKGTDESYLSKQHSELSSHSHYVMGTDKRRWWHEFGILHYAGPVVYDVTGFLDKNKDVQQYRLFENLSLSTSPYVREIAQYEDLLNTFLSEIRTGDITVRKSGTLAKYKANPTVAGTFHTQLTSLIEVLDKTTPWYVRCLKSNAEKRANCYDDDLMLKQLKYSGMLDIVRIRKEGYPIHVPATVFVQKYKLLITQELTSLPSDPKKIGAILFRQLRIPRTEWQIGKTMIFLRHSVLEPLEAGRKKILHQNVVIVQKYWRTYLVRREYNKMKMAVKVLQNWYRSWRMRIIFIRKKRAICIIQANLRGMRGRKIASELRRKKHQEEMAKKKLEERERLAQEEAEREIQALLEATQKEIDLLKFSSDSSGFTKTVETPLPEADFDFDTILTSVTKSSHTASQSHVHQAGNRDSAAANFVRQISKEMGEMLESNFQALTDSLPTTTESLSRVKHDPESPSSQQLFDDIQIEMDAMLDDISQFQILKEHGNGIEADKKHVHFSSVPSKESVNGNSSYHDTEQTTQSDNEVKVEAMEGMMSDLQSIEQPDGPDMVEFALKYFNVHEVVSKKMGGRRISDPKKQVNVAKADMVTYTKNDVIPTSHLFLENEDDVMLACRIFKELNMYLHGRHRDSLVNVTIQHIVGYGIDHPTLRDEIYCQLIRQTNQNPNKDGLRKGWTLMALCTAAFTPSKTLVKYLASYIRKHQNHATIGLHATQCQETLRRAKLTQRKLPPSIMEIQGNDDHQCHVNSHAYVADVIAEWERQDKVSKGVNNKSSTSSFNGKIRRFVFKKRVFREVEERMRDPVELHLLYIQAVESVVKFDDFPLTEKVAIQLSGLQAQVEFGDFNRFMLSRYQDAERFLPPCITAGKEERALSNLREAVIESHQLYGSGKTKIQAKTLYLACLQQYPLYGTTLYPVEHRGYWQYPNHILLGIDERGVKFVKMSNKALLATYTFQEFDDVTRDNSQNILSLRVLIKEKNSDVEYFEFFEFETTNVDEIVNLIVAYSPHNSQKIIKTHLDKSYALKETRGKLLSDLIACRNVLVESRLLRPPVQDGKDNPWKRTIRRIGSRRLEKTIDESIQGPDKSIFKPHYWYCTRTGLKRSLLAVQDDEFQNTAVKMSSTLQRFSGIGRPGKTEDIPDEEQIQMIQHLIGTCLETPTLCDELYLQLIKQTTVTPGYDGTSSLRLWKLMSVCTSVTIPSNKGVLKYLQSHLKYQASSKSNGSDYAKFSIQSLARTSENRHRKCPPSKEEIQCIYNRKSLELQLYLIDGHYRTVPVDSMTTIRDVIESLKVRIGLQDTSSFAVYAVSGDIEDVLNPSLLVADILFQWEKDAKSSQQMMERRFLFKKRLFVDVPILPHELVEFNLVVHQHLHDIRNGKLPITISEAEQLCGLWAYLQKKRLSGVDADLNIGHIVEETVPTLFQLVDIGTVEDIYNSLTGKTVNEVNQSLLDLISSSFYYGMDIFKVKQSYSSVMPFDLRLAVSRSGVHLLKMHQKETLLLYDYGNIVNYSYSPNTLMIVAGSNAKRTKSVFNTYQAFVIAGLMSDYIQILSNTTYYTAASSSGPLKSVNAEGNSQLQHPTLDGNVGMDGKSSYVSRQHVRVDDNSQRQHSTLDGDVGMDGRNLDLDSSQITWM
ncbi:unconventional myosin heavy chain 6-like [Glandiceps talaboti]